MNVQQRLIREKIDGYAKALNLQVPQEELRRGALEWATTRGSRSGRVAWQFIQDLAGRQGQRLN
jgi:predicted AAA+ superfamily ATPase